MPALFGSMSAPLQQSLPPTAPPAQLPKRKNPLFGWLGGESAMPGVNRMQVIGATLRDVGASLDGGGADNLMNLQLLAQKRQQDQAQQAWQAEEQARKRQEWGALDQESAALKQWVSTQPPSKQMLYSVMPKEALKAEFERMNPKAPEFGWTQNPDGTLAPIPGGPADPNYKQQVNPKAFVINTGGGNPKPPSGYRYTADGNLEPTPGGPAAIKNEANKRKADMMVSSLEDSNANVMSAIKKARELSRVGLTTGLGAMVTGRVGGTDTRNLARQLDVIKSNLGFDKLAEMRASSPTGGALGAVTERELELLQSVVASLDQSQSDEQLRENLDRVEKHYSNMLRRVKSAYNEDFGDQQRAPTENTPPRPKGVPLSAVFDPQTRRWKMP